MTYLSISEAADRLGVHPDTLRRWEKQGLVSPSFTEGGHRRYTETEIVNLMSKVDPHLNRLYEIYQSSDKKGDLKQICLVLGDTKFETRVGHYDILVVTNDYGEIIKIDGNFLLEIALGMLIPNPQLLRIELSADLLKKSEACSFEYVMSLTPSENVMEVSWLTKLFEDKVSPAADRKTLICCHGIYETIELPTTIMRCKKMNRIFNTPFGQHGVVCNFQVLFKDQS